MKTTPNRTSIVCILAVFGLLLTLACGCQSNLTMKRIAAKNPLSKNAQKTPDRMVEVWQTYAQTMPDGKAMRGIAGRIHFYNDAKKKQAIKVDGMVTVFIFDGDEKDPAHAKPLKVFKFPTATLQVHHKHKKPLGHGYDFFLPIDDLNGEEKSLCVMTRFDDLLDDGLVLGAPVSTVLQGTKKPGTPDTAFQEFIAQNTIMGKLVSDASTDQNPIQQVAFLDRTGAENATNGEAAVKEEDGTRKRNVATITLNEQMSRRLSMPGTASDPVPATNTGARPANGSQPSMLPPTVNHGNQNGNFGQEVHHDLIDPMPHIQMPTVEMPAIGFSN